MDWAIKGNEIVRINETDGTLTVSAVEIYSLFRKGEMLLPTLSYSRFPARILIRVISGSSLGIPSISFVATLNGEEIDVPDLPLRAADHVTNGEKWFPFDNGNLEDVKKVLHDCAIFEIGDVRLGQYLDLVRLTGMLGIPLDDRWHGTADSVAKMETDTPFLSNVNATLYQYQIEGAAWLNKIVSQDLGCILGDEMGLGKTLQVIVLLTNEKANNRGPSLVICPATLLENWRREISRFTEGISVLIHQGASRSGLEDDLKAVDIVITSYDTVVRDYLFLGRVVWNCIILDEAQAIKNPDAQRSIAVKTIPRRAAVAVTGTPIENRLEDLWSIVDFVLPGLLGCRSDFVVNFDNTVNDAQRLGPLVSPILLRRRVADVAKDLPPRIDVPQPLVFSVSMASAYEQVRMSAIAEYGKGGALASLIKLRLYTAHPVLLMDNHLDLVEQSPKYNRLLELLEEIFSCGEKVLVFVGFNGMTDLLMGDLPKRIPKIYADFIDGRVAVPDRQPKIDTFSSTSGPGVLFLSPRAAGSGLNITAANHVIHYTPEWNPAIEDQASARAYRRGQTLPVTVHRLFYLNTVEEVMVDRLFTKRKLADGVLTGNAGDSDAPDILRALQLSPLGGI